MIVTSPGTSPFTDSIMPSCNVFQTAKFTPLHLVGFLLCTLFANRPARRPPGVVRSRVVQFGVSPPAVLLRHGQRHAPAGADSPWPRRDAMVTPLSMLTTQDIRNRRDEINRVAARYGARDVRIFGSLARGDATDYSDLDLVVRFEPGRSLLDQGGLLMELRELLGDQGRRYLGRRPDRTLRRDRPQGGGAALRSDRLLLADILDAIDTAG